MLRIYSATEQNTAIEDKDNLGAGTMLLCTTTVVVGDRSLVAVGHKQKGNRSRPIHCRGWAWPQVLDEQTKVSQVLGPTIEKENAKNMSTAFSQKSDVTSKLGHTS